MFLLWFSRGDQCFLGRARRGEFCRTSLLPSCKRFGKKLWYGKVNLISELSAENGVAVVNAYGSIIGDNKDHDDICTSPQWKYPLLGLEFEKLI